MTKIQLFIYVNPGAAEVFINIKRKDGSYRRLSATIDTGAEVSLLPLTVLADVEYRPTERGKVIVQQAGIAKQEFEATEAYVTLFLEDQAGAKTDDFDAPFWFAGTEQVLIGFNGILDRAILHIDMRDTGSGWIELDP
jgi:hypothetical protein